MTVVAYALNTFKEMNTYKAHNNEFVHVRENRLDEALKRSGLTFGVLSQVKGDPLVLLQELAGAGVHRADDRLNLIAAVQAGDLAAFEKVLHQRLIEGPSVTGTNKTQVGSVELAYRKSLGSAVPDAGSDL